jgi:hypothetical protein
MSSRKRLLLLFCAFLAPLLAVGILLASEPKTLPTIETESPTALLDPIGETAAANSSGTWPALRHDSGQTGFTSDVGVFHPPLAYRDTITLTDNTPDPKVILNLISDSRRLFAMGQYQIWGLKKSDLSNQWRNDYCFPDPVTGDLCFYQYLAADSGWLVALRQKFFFSTFDFGFELVALDAASGLKDWSLFLGESAPEIVLSGGYIYVLTEDDSQGSFARYRLDGGRLYMKNADIDGANSGKAVVAGGRFIYGKGNRILAYNISDGLQSWVYTDTERIDSRQYDIVATDDAVIVSQGERVIKLDIDDGTELWSEDIKPAVCSSTTQPNASTTDGNMILITAVCDDEVVALDYSTGQEKWRESIGYQIASAVAFGGDTIYVGASTTPSFSIFAFDPDSGDELDRIVIGALYNSSVLAIDGDTLWTASNQGVKELLRFERMPADVGVDITELSQAICDTVVGGTVRYRIRVSNFGPGTTANTRVDLLMPPGSLTLHTTHGTCSAGTSPYCELGSLAEYEQAQITATIDLSQAGRFSPGASVSGSVRDPVEANDSANTQLSVNPAVPASLDTYPSDIEITQGIQNLDNDVPLVSNKKTFVRLYARTTGDAVLAATAVLHGEVTGSGEDLGTLTPLERFACQPLNGDIPNRDQIIESFVFALPDTWLDGEVTFKGEINPGEVLPETDFSNNTLEITRKFTVLPRICLKTYPVRTSGNGTDHLAPHFQAIFSDDGNILSRALTMLPAREIKVFPSSHLIEEWEPFAFGGWGPYEMERDEDNRGDVLDTLWWLDLFSNDPNECADEGATTHYVGMVHEDTDNSVGGAGLGIRDGDELMIFLNTGPNGPQAFDDPHGGLTLAHEIGHNYDRAHVDCGDPAPENPGPYPDDRDECNLAPIDPRGYYGLEFRDPTRPTVITPTMAGDVMSYADDVWTSEYTWEAIQDVLCDNAGCSFPRSAPTVIREQSPLPPLDGDVLLVRGYTSPTVSISGILRVPVSQVPEADDIWAAQVSARPITATYALNVLSDTTILHHEPFTPTQMSDQYGEHLSYGLIVPFNPSATHIEITETGSVVISLTVSVSTPTVTAVIPNGGENFTDTLPISWTADDADGDELDFTVQYSADGGSSWQALASGLQTTTFEADISLLPGSAGQGLVKVIASDGLNSGYRQSDAGFSVSNRPPLTAIYYPDNGGIYDDLQSLTFTGGAFDPEEGHIGGSSLAWSIDGIGEIGTGSSTSVSELSHGTYTATLTATDNQSQTASASITFTIQPVGGFVAPISVVITGSTEGVASESILFQANVSPISTTEPITYVWQITGHDDITVTSGSSNIRAISWELSGQKTITVTAFNAVGSSSGSYSVTIFEPVSVDFTASPTHGGAPLLVSFTNESLGDYDTCLWEFGDGDSDSSCGDTEHTYTGPGVYTVSLSVSGVGGSEVETKTAYIIVEQLRHVFIPLLNKTD